MEPEQSKSLNQVPLALVVGLWALLAVLLALPVWLALKHVVEPPPRWAVATGSVGLVLVLAGFTGLLQKRWALWLAGAALLLVLWLRAVHFGLVEFSGAGFTREFFIHMEWRSLVVAWQEYSGQFGRAALLLVLAAAALAGLARAGLRTGRLPATGMLLLGLLAIGLARAGMPERDLLLAWQQWNQPITTEFNAERLAEFEASGLLESHLVPKYDVLAQAPAQPKNLILLYVESAGFTLADQPQWPGLMPNYAALLQHNRWLDYLWTSSFITIEGLTNSMCGTLFPYLRGSNSMAEGEGLAENLACFADVLARAGYHQVYLGGADLSFAGKGEFLSAHGYDDVRGLEYWQGLGLNQRPQTWGLSDADLFEQSLLELRRLHDEGKPFNLTMLTIGTHLPGYFYSECAEYPGSDDRFLQAAHCTDQLLGNWLEQLTAQGLLDNTLLVITADHHVFPSPDMRKLFGENVFDRRLPLIVLGDDIPAPVNARGASYDLAPTLLDMLEIEHNASFLLGRSLLRPTSRPDYFVTRYPDIHAGKQVNNQSKFGADLGCGKDSGEPFQLPLSRCEKAEFLHMLNARVLGLSAQTWPIMCDGLVRSLVAIPADAEEPIEVYISNRSQADRFIYNGRRVSPGLPGLFLMFIDTAGQVVARRFYPADAVELTAIEVPEGLHDGNLANLVLAWRPAPESGTVTVAVDGIVQLELGGKAEIHLLDQRGQTIATAQDVLDLTAAMCPAVAP
jgi:hypothetical protein